MWKSTKKVFTAVFFMSLFLLIGSLTAVPAKAGAPNGIRNNGMGGIWIDINAAPYTTYAAKPHGENAYRPWGCAWFAAARACQLTGKDSYIYGGSKWYYSEYNTYGYTRGGSVRARALACYDNHVSVVEKVEGDYVIISEGGFDVASYAANGYCRLERMTVTNLEKARGGRFLGYVYLNSPVPGKTTVSASQQSGSQTVVFSWNATANTKMYDLRIYRNGVAIVTKFGIPQTSYSYTLPVGSYTADVASVYDASSYTFSDRISFNVNSVHSHRYSGSAFRHKATVTANGYIDKYCSCGKKLGREIIYYPRSITLSRTSYTYDGNIKKPSVKVVGSDNKIISSKYYTVNYSSGCRRVGRYKVTITFRGNYSGSATRTFNILKKGHKHNYQKVVVKATTTKNGSIRYVCSCGMTKGQQIIYRPVSMSLSSTQYYYDGKAKTPQVKVTDGRKKVISASCYTVSYPYGRKKKGTYKVTVRFKGYYSGALTKSFTIISMPKKWVYSDKLPSGVTSARYTIQYNNTYKKTSGKYVNDGGTFESVYNLPTSASRVLRGYYYFHFCGPTTGRNVNYAFSGPYVHFDSVAADKADVAGSGADSDPGITYYLLNWKGTGSRVWCASGTTCDGSYGSHGARGQAWYRMNIYQNRKYQTSTTTTQSGWVSYKDRRAVKTTYRYRAK